MTLMKEPRWRDEDFGLFVARLDPDGERGAEVYDRLYRRIQYFFEGWHDAASYAAELADATIDRLIAKCKENPAIAARDLTGYAVQVARYILMEYRREPRLEPLAIDPPDPGPRDDDDSQPARLGCLRSCLNRLPESDYLLLKDYHAHDRKDRIRTRQKAGLVRGLSSGAVRVKVFRLHRTLERCIEQCVEQKAVTVGPFSHRHI